MPQLTVSIAGPGTYLDEGGRSLPGHTWYTLTDNAGNTTSYGFAPVEHGTFWGPGQISNNDNTNYLSTTYSKTIDISDAQFEKLQSFGENPAQYGFDTTYFGLSNSCIDFVWNALNKVNPDATGFEGTQFPDNPVNMAAVNDALAGISRAASDPTFGQTQASNQIGWGEWAFDRFANGLRIGWGLPFDAIKAVQTAAIAGWDKVKDWVAPKAEASELNGDPLDRSEPDGSVFASVAAMADPADGLEPDGSVFESVPPMGDPLDRFEPDGSVFQSVPPMGDPLDRFEPDGSVFQSVPPMGDPLDRFEPDGSVFQSVPPMGDPLDRYEPDGSVFQSTPPSNPPGGGGGDGHEHGTTAGTSFVAAHQRTDPLDRSEPDGSVFPSVPPMGDPLDRSEPDGSVFQSDQQQASPTSPDQLETYGTDASGIWNSPGEAYASASPSGLNAAETATEIAGVSFNSAAEPPTGNVVMDTDTFTPNETNNEVFNDTGSGGFSNYGGSFYGGGSYGGGFYGGGSYGGGFYGGGFYGGGFYGGGS